MMIRMQPQRVESERLLAWLSKMISERDSAEVEIVVIDEPQGQSSVQITLRDLPGPMVGSQVRALRLKARLDGPVDQNAANTK